MTPLPPEVIEKAKEIAGEEYGVLGCFRAAERGMAWMMEPVCQTCGGTGHSWYDCADRNVPYRDSFPEDITRAEWFRRQEGR